MDQQAEKDKTERVTGLGRRTREKIAEWGKMAALRFQTGERHQTSPASLKEAGGGERDSSQKTNKKDSYHIFHSNSKVAFASNTNTQTVQKVVNIQVHATLHGVTCILQIFKSGIRQ